MILVEFFYHLVSLDLVWLFNFAISNFLFTLMFAFLVFKFWEGKHFFEAFFMLIILAWIWEIFGTTSGLNIFVPAFLMLYYITKIAVLRIAESVPALQNKMVLVGELQFFTIVILFKIFVVG